MVDYMTLLIFLATLAFVFILLGAIWIEDWMLKRKRLRNTKPCPDCGSKNIRHCIDVSEGTEYKQCIDCGKTFPHEGQPSVGCFCYDDGECESFEFKSPKEVGEEQ